MAKAIGRIPRLFPCHCRALYVFLVNGALYEGWFALVAKSQAEALGFAEALKGQSVLIKYDPRKPTDSVVEGQKVLEKKIIQDTNLLNPKVGSPLVVLVKNLGEEKHVYENSDLCESPQNVRGNATRHATHLVPGVPAKLLFWRSKPN